MPARASRSRTSISSTTAIASRGVRPAIEGGQSWAVDYTIVLDANWTTRRARISGRSVSGLHSVVLEADGAGHWLVDGENRASPARLP